MKRVIYLLLAAGCSGQFDVGTPDMPAEFEGRLVRAEGAVANAVVALYEESDPIAEVRSDSEGRFRIDVMSEGRLQIAIHDREGFGALVDVLATPGILVDVGELELRPLHQRPEVLALRGLGYEERVTRLASNNGELYTARIDDRRQLLAVSATEDGQSVVRTAVLQMSETATTVEWPTLAHAESAFYAVRLPSDQGTPVVFVQTYADGGAGNRDWLVGPNRATVINQSRDRDRAGLYDDGHETTVLWEERGALQLERWSRQGERVMTLSLDDQRLRWAGLSGRERRVLVFDVNSGTTSVSAFDLKRLTFEPCGPRGRVQWTLTTDDDATIVGFGDLGQSPMTLDVARVDIQGCRSLARVVVPSNARWPLLSGDTLYLLSGESSGVWAVDVEGGDVAFVDRSEVDDPDFRACIDPRSQGSCGIVGVWDNRMRFLVGACPGDRDVCMIDVFEDSSSRNVPVTRAVGRWMELVSSPGGRWDVWTRSVNDGPVQAFVAPAIGIDASFRQATWFPRDHLFLAFGPDERWIYTVMQDPIDDRRQVFRVPTEPR